MPFYTLPYKNQRSVDSGSLLAIFSSEELELLPFCYFPYKYTELLDCLVEQVRVSVTSDNRREREKCSYFFPEYIIQRWMAFKGNLSFRSFLKWL
jgi:hypothetical protein